MPWPPRSSELQRIDWDDYLDDPGLALAVSVTHQERPGEPRGHYVVMVVFISEGLGA